MTFAGTTLSKGNYMPRQSMIFTALAVFTVIAASVAAVPAGAETRAGEVIFC
jgi:hypothetical protein